MSVGDDSSRLTVNDIIFKCDFNSYKELHVTDADLKERKEITTTLNDKYPNCFGVSYPEQSTLHVNAIPHHNLLICKGCELKRASQEEKEL